MPALPMIFTIELENQELERDLVNIGTQLSRLDQRYFPFYYRSNRRPCDMMCLIIFYPAVGDGTQGFSER